MVVGYLTQLTNVAFYAHSGGKNQQVEEVLGSDYQRATRITYAIQQFEVMVATHTFSTHAHQ